MSSSGGLPTPYVSVDKYLPAYKSNVDATSGFQAAMNAAGAIGAVTGAKCPLVCTPGRQYTLNSVLPVSFVDLIAYGSKFVRPGNYAGLNVALFDVNPDAGVGSAGITQFCIRGATYVGQNSVAIDGQEGLVRCARSSLITVKHNNVSNLAGSAIYLQDVTGFWVDNNTLTNCTLQQQQNTINLVQRASANVSPLMDGWVRGNRINGSLNGHSICYATNTTAPPTPYVGLHIVNNNITDAGVAQTMGIAVELVAGATPPELTGFEIGGNHVVRTGANLKYGIAVWQSAAPHCTDPLYITGVNVHDNYIKNGNGNGILLQASRSRVIGNTINASADDIYIANYGDDAATLATVNHLTVVGNGDHLGSGATIHQGNGVDATTLVTAGNAA